MVLPFNAPLEIAQGIQPPPLEFSNPALLDFMDRDRVQVMQLLASLPLGDDKIGSLKHTEMLCDRLPAHVQTLAELAEGLTVGLEQSVKQLPAAGIGERLEDVIHCSHFNMQVINCMSSRTSPVGLARVA